MDKLHTVEQHRLKLMSLLQSIENLTEDADNILLNRAKSDMKCDDLFLLKHKIESLKVLADEVKRSLFKK